MLLFRGLVNAGRCIPIAAGLLCLYLCWPIITFRYSRGSCDACKPASPLHRAIPSCMQENQRGAWVVVGGRNLGLGPAFQPAAEVWSWNLPRVQLTFGRLYWKSTLTIRAQYQKPVKASNPNRPML